MAGVFHGFFDEFNAHDFFGCFCQIEANGSCTAIGIEDSFLALKIGKSGYDIVELFGAESVRLKKGKWGEAELERAKTLGQDGVPPYFLNGFGAGDIGETIADAPKETGAVGSGLHEGFGKLFDFGEGIACGDEGCEPGSGCLTGSQDEMAKQSAVGFEIVDSDRVGVLEG